MAQHDRCHFAVVLSVALHLDCHEGFVIQLQEKIVNMSSLTESKINRIRQ